MKLAISSSRNLRELAKAEQGLLPDQQRAKMAVLIGALSVHVSPEVWDQCLNTAYGYIASCEVKLQTYELGPKVWHAFDRNRNISNDSILGVGPNEQAAREDFWKQWKERREEEEI